MTEQEELIQEIRERPGEMPRGALPFDLLAFATTVGERYSMMQNEIIRLVMNESRGLGRPHRVESRRSERLSAGQIVIYFEPRLRLLPALGRFFTRPFIPHRSDAHLNGGGRLHAGSEAIGEILAMP